MTSPPQLLLSITQKNGVFTDTGLPCGGYLSLKALWWPSETGETAVLVAGLLLTLATFLLLYMVRPGVSEALAQPDEQGNSGRAPQLQVPVTTYSVAVEPREKVAHAVAGH